MIFLYFFLYFIFGGCSSVDEKLPTSGSEYRGSSSGLIGSWEGLLIAKSVVSRIESAASPETQEMPIVMKLLGKTDDQGQFFIYEKKTDAVKVSGNFRNFAGKSLMLSINSSNFSLFGLAGSDTDFPYELTGNSLLLSNDRATLKLSRIIDSLNSRGEDEDLSDEKKIFTRWKCEDSMAKDWILQLKPEQKFSLDILSKDSRPQFLWMDGRIESGKNYQFLLLVERSSNGKYKGLRLIGEYKNQSEIVIRRSASEEQPGFEKVECHRA